MKSAVYRINETFNWKENGLRRTKLFEDIMCSESSRNY